MSTDASVASDLMQVLKDGEEGFKKAAGEMSTNGRAEVAKSFETYSAQRTTYYAEIEHMAAAYGDHIEESGSLVGKLHRGWMSFKEALPGSAANAVLDAAEQGEDHAKNEYKDALAKDISSDFRVVVQRQYEGICKAHDDVKGLRDMAAAN